MGLVLEGPIGDEASNQGLLIREQRVSGPRMFVMMVNGSVEDGAGCLSRRCLSRRPLFNSGEMPNAVPASLASLALIIARNEYELLHNLILKFLLRPSLPSPSVASVFTVEMLSFFKKIRLTASGIATLEDLILV